MARETKKSGGGIRWRLWFGGAALFALCISTAVAGLKVREYALTDPQFLLLRDVPASITVEGLVNTSLTKVRAVFSGDFGRSIFAVPLPERRRRLLAIDWVETASVSRIWPNRLVVRLRERKPVAFVVLRTGVVLIDARGVLLDPPPQTRFEFPVLRGVLVEEPENRRRDRVRALLQVQSELGQSARDISEVNATDPENVRLIAQVEGRAVELILGEMNFGSRYRNFLSHYPEILKRSPEVKTFDLRLDDRITVKE